MANETAEALKRIVGAQTEFSEGRPILGRKEIFACSFNRRGVLHPETSDEQIKAVARKLNQESEGSDVKYMQRTFSEGGYRDDVVCRKQSV